MSLYYVILNSDCTGHSANSGHPCSSVRGKGTERGKEPIVCCPYCIERGQFRPMVASTSGSWYMCAPCGHVAMPHNHNFKCTCALCATREPGPNRPKN